MSRLAEQIRGLVLNGDLSPGAKLDEQMLAERFDVSRTPVREALRQLASTGLIELKPRRGAYVSSLSPSTSMNASSRVRSCPWSLAE